MDPAENKSFAITADLYFLIQRFLSSGPLKKTLQVLNEELEEHKILPKRLDWKGGEHERTVEDMQKQFPYIRPDYLLQLCYQATNNTPLTFINNNNLQTFLCFRPKIPNKDKKLQNYNQLCNYIIRLHGVPTHNVNDSFNIVNTLRGREISGPFSRHRAITPKLYCSVQHQRTTVGHLSAVYCLLFDHSGNYIITGADDLLIKLWSSHTGRLIASFRGAACEITDIAVNLENTLLAAGSIDRILRIWNLQNGSPVAVLPGHTGMITSVNFCPTPCWGIRYLITTSTDGSIAFWTYNYDCGGKAEFRSKPLMYQEKVRPGQSQMICSSFSPGGTFLATGSADHHVRVYYMKGDEGPHRILEIESHSDRVDSIQWAHSGIRFISGSKDGTAIIWWFETQQWKTIYLNMTTKLSNTAKKVPEEPKKLKVTMVTFNKCDNLVVTAVSDYSLKVWIGHTGQLEKVLTGHTDEVYVLEPHPHDNSVILSAGHDGQLFVWDIVKGEVIAKFLNSIEGQGYGAIFDGRWSPNGCSIAASDSHGHILIFGFGNGSSYFEQLPRELFFHTDYRPLVRDANDYVLDEQTQIPPHLMPPPFLVDIDGNPYPPMLQRLVPGRENCNTEQLVPNIIIGNEGTQEVIQDVHEGHRLVSGDDVRGNSSTFRNGRRTRDERIRQSTGDWQSDPNMEWKRSYLVKPLKPSAILRAREFSEFMEEAEVEEYRRQMCQRPHMICTSTSSTVKANDKKKNKHSTYQTRTPKRQYQYRRSSESAESSANEEEDLSESSGYSDWMAEEGVKLTPPKRSKRRQVVHNISFMDQDDDDEDEDDVDEEEDEDDHTSNPEEEKVKAVREKKVMKKVPISTPGPSTSGTTTGATTATSNNLNKIPRVKISELYKLSEWLSETRPRKTPYYPQMGDELVYFVQGHELYLQAVRLKNIYEVNSAKDLPCTKMVIRDHEYVKVIGIQYELKPPRLCCLKLALLDEEGRLTGKIFTVKYHDMPDVLDFFIFRQHYSTAMSRNWKPGDKFRCIIDDEWWVGLIVGKTPAVPEFPISSFMCYEIKYHNGEQERMSPWDLEPLDEERLPSNEAESVPVLKEELDAILYKSVPDDWPNGDRVGASKHILAGLTKVMELAIAEPFLAPVDITVYPTYALSIEYPIDLSTIKARFENDFYRRLTAAQFDIRYLATNAEKFNERHSIIVKHARILTELCLRIVKACTQYIDVPAIYHQLVDTYASSDTEDEVEIQPSSSRTLRALPERYSKDDCDWKADARSLVDAIWECEDSIPFRAPVNPVKYPDYLKVIKSPMDLGTAKDNLIKDKYATPQQFCQDMRLIFQNSRTFNTNKRSRIYVMTVRLSAIFEEHIKKIIDTWKTANRRETVKKLNENSLSDSTTFSSSSSSTVSSKVTAHHNHSSKKMSSEESESEDDIPLTSLKVNKTTTTESDSTSQSTSKIKIESNQDSEDSEDSSYKPENDGVYNNSSNRSRRKQYKSSSSELEGEDTESSEDSDGYEEPKRSMRSTRVRKKVRISSDSDELSLSVIRSKRRRVNKVSGSESDNNSRTSGQLQNGASFTSVSSRGRIRKLTPRVRALMGKDMKFI